MSSFATNAVCTDNALCSRASMKETVRVMKKEINSNETAANPATPSLGERISGSWSTLLSYTPRSVYPDGH